MTDLKSSEEGAVEHEKRVTTGVAMLDMETGGGFLKERTYLATGAPGTGKSVFALQFIMQALRNGSRCAYVTSAEKPSALLADADSLGWNLREYIEKNHLVLLDISPYLANLMGTATKQVKDPGVLVGDIAKYVKRINADRLVIDPINPLLNMPPGLSADAFCREFVFSLEDRLNCTTLLTANSAGRAVTDIFEHYVAGVISLDVSWRGRSFERTMTIRKMRATAVDMISSNFTICADDGIKLLNGIESAHSLKLGPI